MPRRQNGGDRGNSRNRRARKLWLLDTFAADRVLLVCDWGPAGPWTLEAFAGLPEASVLALALPEERPYCRIERCCRCYRCGKLLTYDTLTADRIIPGARGGTYRRDNLRPACIGCQRETGAELSILVRIERGICKAVKETL